MSTTRINELPAAAGVASNDFLAIDNTSGVSQKITAAQLVNVDNTLSVTGRPADAKATGDAISAEASARAQAISAEAAARESVGTEVDELKSVLINYNEFNVVEEYGLHNDVPELKGITWTWNGNVCSVSGTATDGTFLNLIVETASMPEYLVPGRSYWIIYNATDSGIKIEVLIYKNGSYYSTERFGETVEYTIPADASGIIVRLYVAKNTTVDGTIYPIILNAPTTAIIDEKSKYLAPKVACFGDSLTWGRDGSGSSSTQTEYTITKYLAKKGCSATNYGVGGMGYFVTSGGQNALAKLQATSLTGYDVITLGFGTNDNSAALGTIDDTDGTTMLGAMYQCWQYIRTQNSTCVVVFIAPPNASTFGTKADRYWYGYKRGPLYDYNLSDLVEGMRAFCGKYNIPFIDNLSNGIDIENITTLLPDGIHPNDNGYKIYSRYIAESILSCAYANYAELDALFEKRADYADDQRSGIDLTTKGNPLVITNAALSKRIDCVFTGGSNSELRWNGKNLFAISPAETRFTKNGVTFTFNKDEGRISVESSGATGTAVSTQQRGTLNGKANMDINFKFVFPENTVITISSNATQFRDYNAKWYLQITDGTTAYFEDGNGYTMTALAGVEYGMRVIIQSGFATTERLDIYPQLEIGDHKTVFEPYIGGVVSDVSDAGNENIFDISHNITASSNNVSWKLSRANNAIEITSIGASTDTVVYDTSLDLSHGSYNLWHFTPEANTAFFLSGANRDGLRLQISDGTYTWTDYGDGVGLTAESGTEYYVRLLVKQGFVGAVTMHPVVATGMAIIHGLDTTVLYTNDSAVISASYEQRPVYDSAYICKDTTKAVMELTGDKVLAPFKSFKPIVTFIDDDTSTLTDVNNYASVFTALGEVGTYAVMTRNLENSAELKQRLLDLETAGFGMVFHCEYQEGAETNYFLNDSNRDMELVRENITLGLRQMETYGFQNYRHWVTPYGVNDKDIVDVAKDYGLESLISMSNNSWVANTGNVSRYNIPRYSVSTSTPSDFPAIKIAANECLNANGWLLIVTHANTWRHNNVVTEMQTLLTSVINYLTGIGFEVVPFARAYESRKGMFYFNELF